MPLEVGRLHPANLTSHELDAAVVIDVLRATSTAIVLLARGVPAVRIVATPQELARLPSPPTSASYLIFSELDESRSSGLECVDNSPALAEEIPLEGRLPVLVTTNGTRAVAAAMRCARTVFVASFVNVSSMARHLRLSAARVTLLPAGDFGGGDIRTEDERCADTLEQMLRGETPDLARLLAECRTDARVQRRIARHPDLVRDIEIALDVDRHDVVATVVPAPPGAAFDLIRVR